MGKIVKDNRKAMMNKSGKMRAIVKPAPRKPAKGGSLYNGK